MVIGLSTLMTYRHHAVDVLGGAVLAILSFHLFHESAARLPVVPDFAIGSRYGVAAVAALTLATITWPWGSPLVWIGAALGIAAAGYFGLGPGIYRKTGGKLPWSTRFVMAPLLVGQFLSLLYYRRQCRAWDEVVPGVWIGRKLTRNEARDAVSRGVVAVLDLTAEFSEASPFLAMTYRQIPILDLTTPLPDQLREAAQFIGEQSARGTVYVHCKIGYSRSAAAVAAYMLVNNMANTAEEAVDLLRRVRPSIVIRPEAMRALRDFEQNLSVDVTSPEQCA
jgi:protein-tyrosine phosphatase